MDAIDSKSEGRGSDCLQDLDRQSGSTKIFITFMDARDSVVSMNTVDIIVLSIFSSKFSHIENIIPRINMLNN